METMRGTADGAALSIRVVQGNTSKKKSIKISQS